MSTKSARNRRYKRRKAAEKRERYERRERVESFVREGSFAEAMSCARKCAYSSEETAELVALRNTLASGQDIRVYQCPFCGKWHLTSKPFKPEYEDSSLFEEMYYESLEASELERWRAKSDTQL